MLSRGRTLDLWAECGGLHAESMHPDDIVCTIRFARLVAAAELENAAVNRFRPRAPWWASGEAPSQIERQVWEEARTRWRGYLRARARKLREAAEK